MKKLITLFVLAALIVSTGIGCGGSGTTKSSGTGASPTGK